MEFRFTGHNPMPDNCPTAPISCISRMFIAEENNHTCIEAEAIRSTGNSLEPPGVIRN